MFESVYAAEQWYAGMADAAFERGITLQCEGGWDGMAGERSGEGQSVCGAWQRGALYSRA